MGRNREIFLEKYNLKCKNVFLKLLTENKIDIMKRLRNVNIILIIVMSRWPAGKKSTRRSDSLKLI